jgi:chemotaxis protein histidine kinase CheA
MVMFVEGPKPMSVETEDAFQKDLVDLFVQEAQEWLQQIHVALDELQQAPPFERHRALAQTIKVGITNLGGSAATLNLSDVERASFAALPFVEAVQDPSARITADDFIALCKHLGHVHGALTRATGVAFDEKHVPASGDDQPTMIATRELLVLLRGLQDQYTASDTSHRNVVQTMMAQAEELMERGVEQCNVASIQEFLDRSAQGDQGFLHVVRQELPHLTAVLRTLKKDGVVPSPPSSDLQNAVERVAQLWSAAQQVNASHAMVFFMGLHSFLTIVMQDRVAVSAQNYDAIQSRLGQNVTAIEEWAESGRRERLAIQGALPQ